MTTSRVVRYGLAALLIALLAVAASHLYPRRYPNTIDSYQEAYGKVDRLVISGIRADKETGQILAMEGEITNRYAIKSLSNAFFASTQALSSPSPPIAGTRLHTKVEGFSGSQAVCEFEVVGMRRVFFNKYLWADIPGADLPETIKQALERNNSGSP